LGVKSYYRKSTFKLNPASQSKIWRLFKKVSILKGILFSILNKFQTSLPGLVATRIIGVKMVNYIDNN